MRVEEERKRAGGLKERAKKRAGRESHATRFELNTDFIMRLGCGGGGNCGFGCGSSKTRTFYKVKIKY